MGKKKKFIEKKNSVTYHLVHRSQKDPLAADDTASKFVLQEVPKAKITEIKLKLPSEVFPSEVEESVGLLNKAAPLRGPQLDWDPEIVATLDDGFDFEDPNNQLDDDFIKTANAPGKKEYGDSDAEDDDFAEDGDDDSSLNEFFGDLSVDETKSQFTDYSLSSSVIRRTDGLKMLDNMFEKIFEEYEDQEIGALDQDEITGYMTTNSEIFQKIVDDYEKEREESKKTEFNHELVKRWLEDDDDQEKETETKENLVIEEPTEKWDCESILSTYSTLYNHPKLITEPRKRKICVSSSTGIPKGTLHERLTAKQLAIFDKSTAKLNNFVTPREKVDTIKFIRPKNESKDEKLARKIAVKEHRQKRREEKKANTAAFKEEKKLQEKVMLNVKQNAQGKKLE